MRSMTAQLRSLAAGAAQPNISVTKAAEFPISIPPADEQKRIVAKLELLTQPLTQLKLALER